MAVSFTAGTLNANGILDSKNRNSLFCWLKSVKTNVTFLQETHCHSPEIEETFRKEWGRRDESIWSLGTNHSRGVAVLFNFDCDYSIENVTIDKKSGRYIYFELIINEQRFKMINIYAPNDSKERETFFCNMNNWIDLSDNNLAGGDYNCTHDSNLDRYNCSSTGNDEGREVLHELMNKKCLEDVWRRRYPDTRRYTWSRDGKRSRLDYWLISKSLDSSIEYIDIVPCTYSDHDMVLVKIKMNDFERGPGCWKMNATVVKSELFQKCFTNFWSSWREKKNEFSDIGMWWDLGKVKIKEIATWCSGRIKNDNIAEKEILVNRIKILKAQENCNQDQLYEAEQRLNVLLDKENNGFKIRSRVRWFEDGEQSTKYFHSIEKTKAKNKDFIRIFDENKSIKSGTEEVMKVQVDFYSKLYKSDGINQNDCNYFGQFITKSVSENSRKVLNECISFDELTNALKKMKIGKSPGPDGIIIEFYKLYWDIIGQDLFDVFLGCHKSNRLSYSQYMALIILLYKKGIREDIRNWRPISLSNSDIKILSKLLAERLKIALPEIIDSEQSGCVKGRKIGHSIRLIDDLFVNLNDQEVMLLTDKMKAFDMVEWEWLFFVLNRFGFGSYFIGWIIIMYQGMKSAVMTNGFISKYFTLTRSIRQGDPLSALLYIIQAEPLAECIRQARNIKGIDIKCDNRVIGEIRGSQYVDDSTNMLRNCDYIENCLNCINRFGQASGSRINDDKTVALVSKNFCVPANVPQNITFKTGIDKMLGVPLGDDSITDKFWNDKLAKMKKKINFWKTRDLTMIGKIHVVKSTIIPLIYYGVSHVYIKNQFINDVQALIWDFVWEWDTCLVSKNMIYLPRTIGGLGMPNFNLNVKAARIKMLIDVMKDESKWNIIARKYFKILDLEFGIENFALLADDSSSLIQLSEIPIYYKNCITAFHEICKLSRCLMPNELLWYNSRIKFKGKSLCFKNWVRSGLNYVSNIVQNNVICDDYVYTNLLSRNNCFSELLTIKRSVPHRMLEKCTDNERFPSFEDLCFQVPYKQEVTNVFRLTTRDIYLILLNPQAASRKSEQYWSRKLEVTDIDFNSWYKYLFLSKYLPRQIQIFNWRIFHGQVLTGNILRYMKFSEKCSVCKCNDVIEDRIHLFIECKSLKEIWEFIDNMFSVLNFKPLSVYDKIVGFYKKCNEVELKNIIIGIARWRIWKRRCSYRMQKGYAPRVSVLFQFKYDLKTHIDTLLESKYATKMNCDLFKKVSELCTVRYR